ncbi:MAG: efflux RND transporter periplasmic adaptor subunit [Planctomycetota bacterium]|jgi:HlyD family secretion protein
MRKSDVKFRLSRNISFVLGAVVAIAVIVGIGAIRIRSFGSRRSSIDNQAVFAVKRGPLRISVTESGTIKAAEQVILKSEVEGRTSILSLIPEGTAVKKGDLLVELDGSQLVDGRIDQQIIVQNAEAAFIGARETLAVVANQAQSDIDIAELTLKFAEQDLQQYLDGEYPNLVTEARAKITLADEELTRARETLEWSQKLFDEKYISATELQKDKLAAKRAELDLDLAKNSLDLLEKYTYQRNLDQLESDVKQAGMALERTKRKASADVAQAKADLTAKQSEYARQQDKLKKIEEQIAKTKVYAPADGLVIYATSARSGGWRSSREPLDVGQDVMERQELIYLPTTSAVKAEVDIHETSLKKVKLGLPAVITIDALPGKTFFGNVAHIAPLPDAQSMWMNPDLKVYNTEIYMDSNDSSLRTGMSCKAKIIIEQYEDALYIPVQAVVRVAGEPTVYVSNGKMFGPRSVDIGMDNNLMVRITDGLEEGEIVWLTPPLKSAGLEQRGGAVSKEPTILEEESREVYRRVDENLARRATAGSDGEVMPAADRRPRRRRGAGGPGETGRPRQRKSGRQGLEKVSPEDRQKMREKLRNISPEQRDKIRRQSQGGKE